MNDDYCATCSNADLDSVGMGANTVVFSVGCNLGLDKEKADNEQYCEEHDERIDYFE